MGRERMDARVRCRTRVVGTALDRPQASLAIQKRLVGTIVTPVRFCSY